jgi:hypothetical protein
VYNSYIYRPHAKHDSLRTELISPDPHNSTLVFEVGNFGVGSRGRGWRLDCSPESFGVNCILVSLESRVEFKLKNYCLTAPNLQTKFQSGYRFRRWSRRRTAYDWTWSASGWAVTGRILHRASQASCLSARQIYRTGSLLLPGYPSHLPSSEST